MDKIKGLIYGCAIGDVLGLQVEGFTKEILDKNFPDGVKDFSEYGRRGIPPGDWSDDTDQLILLMDVLAENKKFNAKKFAQKLLTWRDKGFEELGDIGGCGIGRLTSRCLSHKSFLTNPYQSALYTYRELGGDSAPNGAIMRCGISAIYPDWDKVAIKQAGITHADRRCVYSSWFITCLCRANLMDKHINLDLLYQYAPKFMDGKRLREFNKYKKIYDTNDITKLELGKDGFGYTLKGLGCAIYAYKNQKNKDYETIQLEIVNEAGDADTNAAISGQVLGAYCGYSKLPKKWLDKLRYKEWLDKKINRLFEKI